MNSTFQSMQLKYDEGLIKFDSSQNLIYVIGF
jgi:hypothetical protein